jgi:osmoprotectant transport system ATP-binding protein
MLELIQVSKKYGTESALHRTDLHIAAGQTTVLIGPSGCGKSTLLRLMLGLIWSDTGHVRFEGIDLDPASVLTLRRRLGYVTQDGGLFPHLTAGENTTIMARFLGWDPVRIQKRLAELSALTQFPPEALPRYPVEISGGQRQRVSLMRALMLDPDVVLLDEPLGALDPIIRSELQVDLRRIFQTLGKTVVLVTHDLAEANYLGDTIVLLRAGRIVQQGTLAELAAKPADPFVTTFISAQRRTVNFDDRNAP